jgi:hypothetical protein
MSLATKSCDAWKQVAEEAPTQEGATKQWTLDQEAGFEAQLERQRESFLLQRRALASAGAAPAEVPAGLFLFDSSGARFSSSGPASSSLVRSYFSRT